MFVPRPRPRPCSRRSAACCGRRERGGERALGGLERGFAEVQAIAPPSARCPGCSVLVCLWRGLASRAILAPATAAMFAALTALHVVCCRGAQDPRTAPRRAALLPPSTASANGRAPTPAELARDRVIGAPMAFGRRRVGLLRRVRDGPHARQLHTSQRSRAPAGSLACSPARRRATASRVAARARAWRPEAPLRHRRQGSRRVRPRAAAPRGRAGAGPGSRVTSV